MNASEAEFEPTADPVAILQRAADGSQALDAQVALEAEALERQRAERQADDTSTT